MSVRECYGQRSLIVVAETTARPTPFELSCLFRQAGEYVGKLAPAQMVTAVNVDYGEEVTCLTLVIS